MRDVKVPYKNRSDVIDNIIKINNVLQYIASNYSFDDRMFNDCYNMLNDYRNILKMSIGK